ncbi:MAG TPA: hypothetical protein VHT51_13225 [Micropepsaceae bacterium]|jgi:hypothetical protein|nr:hypothetical protein [Micropepsaceae bacterium]
MRAQNHARKYATSLGKQKARPQFQIVRAPEPDRCPLCDGVIERFDRETFEMHARCAPCHEALGDD